MMRPLSSTSSLMTLLNCTFISNGAFLHVMNGLSVADYQSLAHRPTGLATPIIMSTLCRTRTFRARSATNNTTQAIMAKLLKIAEAKDVPPGQAAAFTIEGQKIALFNVEGTYYAIGDTCTHRAGPLSGGDVQGAKVTCPWHGAQFDLKTGAILGPPA
jgi:nitrite reductase/ring-hydroxylating ferredoxin subunit